MNIHLYLSKHAVKILLKDAQFNKDLNQVVPGFLSSNLALEKRYNCQLNKQTNKAKYLDQSGTIKRKIHLKIGGFVGCEQFFEPIRKSCIILDPPFSLQISREITVCKANTSERLPFAGLLEKCGIRKWDLSYELF